MALLEDRNSSMIDEIGINFTAKRWRQCVM